MPNMSSIQRPHNGTKIVAVLANSAHLSKEINDYLLPKLPKFIEQTIGYLFRVNSKIFKNIHWYSEWQQVNLWNLDSKNLIHLYQARNRVKIMNFRHNVCSHLKKLHLCNLGLLADQNLWTSVILYISASLEKVTNAWKIFDGFNFQNPL